MQNSLDRYISDLWGRLRGLPAERKNAELLEIEQHLDQIAGALVASGVERNAAEQAAIAQFGQPKKLASELRRSWRREIRGRLPGTVMTAAVCAWVSAFALGHLARFTHPDPSNGHAMVIWSYVANLIMAIVSGAIVGWVTPRKACAGILVSYLVSSVLGTYRFVTTARFSSGLTLAWALTLYALMIGIALLACIGPAIAVSELRFRRALKAR